MSLSISN